VVGDRVEDAAHMEHSQVKLTLMQDLSSDAQDIAKHGIRTETFVEKLAGSEIVTHDNEARRGCACSAWGLWWL